MLFSEKELYEKIKSIFSGFSQRDIAERLDVTPQLVNKWKTGKARPTLLTLNKIVDETDCSWDELLIGRKAVGSVEDSEASQLKDDLICVLKQQVATLQSQVDDKQQVIDLQRRELEGKSENSELVKTTEEAIETIGKKRSNRATGKSS